MIGEDELEAIRVDATQRIRQLRIDAARLSKDADDPMVLSELHVVISEIRKAQAVVSGPHWIAESE